MRNTALSLATAALVGVAGLAASTAADVATAPPAAAAHYTNADRVAVCTTRIGRSVLRSQARLQTSTNPRFPMRGYVVETTGAAFPGRITARSSAVLYDRKGRAVHRWPESHVRTLNLNRVPQPGEWVAVTTRWTIWVGHVAPLLKASCGVRIAASPR